MLIRLLNNYAPRIKQSPSTGDTYKVTYNTKGKCATPAAEHLFSIRDSPPLDTELSEQFHSRVAKLLYLAKRVRPDILTAISFLTTRTQCATIDDWSKLERVLRYVDASYGMHADGKSHTGLCISLGTGPVFARSAKQHIVTKSSTEAELVGCSDLAHKPSGHAISSSLKDTLWDSSHSNSIFLVERPYIDWGDFNSASPHYRDGSRSFDQIYSRRPLQKLAKAAPR
eukprot:CAMPEP_0170436806 /NCGR_PEP_ID=MMETSP0117_2-20130122/44342_1 /TAXON_ID=400756 /ORGANISM="Durinskia baltica, Strain CSIRO CS-38" /LENGTH=226 /DNA_ID=CAMNT_0010696875 /DNA_START=55 /DNA_END=736 /DNA_ORIENTATION=+